MPHEHPIPHRARRIPFSVNGTGVITPTRDVVFLIPREAEVWTLLCEGLSNRQIAERLGITEKTVKRYISSLYGALGVHNRVQAAMLAVTLGKV